MKSWIGDTLPAFLSRERYQICPSSEVLKLVAGQDLLKLSSKEPESDARHNEAEERIARRDAVKRMVAIDEDGFLSIEFLGKEAEGFSSLLDPIGEDDSYKSVFFKCFFFFF